MSKPTVEEKVKAFYDAKGWVTDDQGKPLEDELFRDLKGGRGAYGEKVSRQAAELLAAYSGTLFVVGCGDLPPSHQLAAQGFDKLVCLDISSRALEIARKKLDGHGDFIEASILDIPFEGDMADAILCSHMLYHIDKDLQQRAVSEMLRITRPGGRIVVLYSNPNSPLMLIQRFLKMLRINKLLGKAPLYFHAHGASWWQGFSDRCDVQVLPNSAISTNQLRALLPTVGLRQKFFAWANGFEDRRPGAAARLWSHVAIVLDKRDD